MQWRSVGKLFVLIAFVAVLLLTVSPVYERFSRGGGSGHRGGGHRATHNHHRGRRHNRVQHSRYEETDRDDPSCSVSGCPDGYLCYVYEDGTDTCIFTT
jgi:hypothetical protein